jgi:hypothetical protein
VTITALDDVATATLTSALCAPAGTVAEPVVSVSGPIDPAGLLTTRWVNGTPAGDGAAAPVSVAKVRNPLAWLLT